MSVWRVYSPVLLSLLPHLLLLLLPFISFYSFIHLLTTEHNNILPKARISLVFGAIYTNILKFYFVHVSASSSFCLPPSYLFLCLFLFRILEWFRFA